MNKTALTVAVFLLGAFAIVAAGLAWGLDRETAKGIFYGLLGLVAVLVVLWMVVRWRR